MNQHSTARRAPWTDLGPEGENLDVHDFLTTRLSALMSSLRRQVTLPYAKAFDLSIAEWRILSLVAYAKILSFGEVAIQSTSDKAQVSRVVRQLEKRGLVTTQPGADSPKKKIDCAITPAGREVYDKLIVLARRRQAEIIGSLTQAERESLFSVIEKLQAELDG